MRRNFFSKLFWIILYNIVIKYKFETSLRMYVCKSYKQHVIQIYVYLVKEISVGRNKWSLVHFLAIVFRLTLFDEFLIFLVDECKWRLKEVRVFEVMGFGCPVHEILSFRFLKQWPISENEKIYWEKYWKNFVILNTRLF